MLRTRDPKPLTAVIEIIDDVIVETVQCVEILEIEDVEIMSAAGDGIVVEIVRIRARNVIDDETMIAALDDALAAQIAQMIKMIVDHEFVQGRDQNQRSIVDRSRRFEDRIVLSVIIIEDLLLEVDLTLETEYDLISQSLCSIGIEPRIIIDNF
jgi:hypothetical protein